jgi:hypothetical protein
MPGIGADDQRDTTFAANGPLIEPVFRHAVFCSATETTDNHIIKMGMASAARWLVVKPILWYTILCTAVEAPDNHLIVGHVDPSTFFNIISYMRMKSQQPSFKLESSGAWS